MKILWLLIRNNAYYYTNMFYKYYSIQFWISQEIVLLKQRSYFTKQQGKRKTQFHLSVYRPNSVPGLLSPTWRSRYTPLTTETLK